MDDLKYTAALHEVRNDAKKVVLPFDMLYIDTTFLVDKDKEFPSRRDVFENISEELTNRESYNENTQFMLNMAGNYIELDIQETKFRPCNSYLLHPFSGHLTQMYLIKRIYTRWKGSIVCVHPHIHDFAESIPSLAGKTRPFCDYENNHPAFLPCSQKFHLKNKRNGVIPSGMVEIKLAATCPPSAVEVDGKTNTTATTGNVFHFFSTKILKKK